MSGRCETCKTSLGLMENYGSNGIKLCYECANSMICSSCGIKVDVNNQIKSNAKMYCPSCHESHQQAEIKANMVEDNENAPTIIHDEVEDKGFFALEKKGIRKGATGGLLMMLIAVVWFVAGYAAGYIFYYPPILFIIGLFALLKGVATGNYSGKD